MPSAAGITILTIKITNEVTVKPAPCITKNVAVKTIKLAGIGTMICSTIHPKKTAQDALAVIKDWA